jgi:membrane protease YdiL (CAAX protease family)
LRTDHDEGALPRKVALPIEPQSRDANDSVIHAGVLLGLIGAVSFPGLQLDWRLRAYGPVLAYLLLTAFVPRLRESRPWKIGGRARTKEIAWAVAIAALSCAGLLAWDAISTPDLHDLRARFPAGAGAGIAFAGLAFAAANSFAEELIWRGVLQRALSNRLGPLAAISLLAVAFGAGHSNGVPRGYIGMVLAGVFGGALGVLYARAGVLWLVWAVHAAADLAIFAIVVAT